MMELLAGIMVAIVAVTLVLEPLVRRSGASASIGLSDDLDAMPLEESESPKVQALLALKEIEFDRATGKLSDEDYAELKGRYGREALAAIDAETEGAKLVAEADDPAEALIRSARSGLQICPSCGPRPETGAQFCSECGRPLAVPVS